jgi:hypothetical protein
MCFKKIKTIVFTGWCDATMWMVSVALWAVILVYAKMDQAQAPRLDFGLIKVCSGSLGIDERISDGPYQHVVFHVGSLQIAQCMKDSLDEKITYAYFKKQMDIWEVHLARDSLLRPPHGKKQPHRYQDLSRQSISEYKKSTS